uniref:ascorbate ferrireductase (transmembrane) n=1 Tax=Parascaris univalens TaxID=6257 RepID=A0A915C3W3_PARUN
MENGSSHVLNLGIILFTILIQPSFSQNITASEASSYAVSPGLKDLLTKIHGSCLVLAWLFFMTVGMMCARYFKSHWSNRTICGLQLWFHVHRTFNLIAAALAIAGLVTILIAHGWRWTGPKVGGGSRNYSIASYHSIFGIFAITFTWLQPFIALLRCGKDHPARAYFNWLHRTLGMVAWVFGIATIVLACNFTKHVTSVQNVTIAICIFLAGTLIAFIVGDALLILLQSKLTTPNMDSKQQQTLLPRISVKTVKYLMTAIATLYVCLTAAVSIAMIYFVAAK